MNKTAYMTAYFDKEAVAFYPGKSLYRKILKYSPKSISKGIKKYNRFVRGKDIPITQQLLLKKTLKEGLATTKNPAARQKMLSQANDFTRGAQADAAQLNKMMVNLGVIPPVLATAAGTGITAAGAAAPYILPTGKTASEKLARRGRPHFDALVSGGDLPDDHNPHLGCPRVDQIESSIQKSWLKGIERLKNSSTPTV